MIEYKSAWGDWAPPTPSSWNGSCVYKNIKEYKNCGVVYNSKV